MNKNIKKYPYVFVPLFTDNTPEHKIPSITYLSKDSELAHIRILWESMDAVDCIAQIIPVKPRKKIYQKMFAIAFKTMEDFSMFKLLISQYSDIIDMETYEELKKDFITRVDCVGLPKRYPTDRTYWICSTGHGIKNPLFLY